MQFLKCVFFVVLLASTSFGAIGSQDLVENPTNSTVVEGPSSNAPLSPTTAAQAPYSSLPFKKSDSLSTPKLMTSYITLMVLLFGTVALLWVVRRRLQHKGALPTAAGQRLRYLERCRLNARTQVYVVAVGSDEYLIADNGQGLAIKAIQPSRPDMAEGSK